MVDRPVLPVAVALGLLLGTADEEDDDGMGEEAAEPMVAGLESVSSSERIGKG